MPPLGTFGCFRVWGSPEPSDHEGQEMAKGGLGHPCISHSKRSIR